MATITRTIKETEANPSTAKSTWTLSVSVDNVIVSGATFTPSGKLTAKYSTVSGKTHAKVIFQGLLRQGEADFGGTGLNMSNPVQWAGNTNKTMNLEFLGSGQTRYYNTDVLFNSTTSTQKTIPVQLYVVGLQADSGKGANLNAPDGHVSNALANLGNWGTLFNVTLDAPPTFDSTQVSFQNTPIYSEYTTASVTLSSISAKYGGYITKVEFTIGSQTITKTYTANSQPTNNAVTLQLNPLTISGTDLIPVVKVTDSRGQVTTKNLNPVTINPYIITATSTKVNRIDADHSTIDDEGTNAVLQATFNYSSFTNSTLIAPEVTLNGNLITPVWYTSWNKSSGFVGKVTDWSSIADGATLYAKVVGPLDVNTAHFLTIKPQTTLLEGSIVNVTLPQSFYLLVGRPGGHGLGIGMKPLDDDLYIQLPTYMIKNQYDSRSTNAITIQNGSSSALTIDWSGNVVASGNITDGSGNVLANKKVNFSKADQTDGGYTVTVASLAGSTYLGQAIELGSVVANKYPLFNGFDILGNGTARIHTLGHYVYKSNNKWYAFVKMRNDNTSAITNFTVTAYIAWITV